MVVHRSWLGSLKRAIHDSVVLWQFRCRLAHWRFRRLLSLDGTNVPLGQRLRVGVLGSLQRLENATSANGWNLVRISPGTVIDFRFVERRLGRGVADVRAQHALELAAFFFQNIHARLQRLQVAHLAGTAVAGVFAVLVAVGLEIGRVRKK